MSVDNKDKNHVLSVSAARNSTRGSRHHERVCSLGKQWKCSKNVGTTQCCKSILGRQTDPGILRRKSLLTNVLRVCLTRKYAWKIPERRKKKKHAEQEMSLEGYKSRIYEKK